MSSMRMCTSTVFALATAVALWSCGDDGGTAEGATATTEADSGTGSPATSTTGQSTGSGEADASTSDDPMGTTSDGDSGESGDPPLPPGQIYEEDFEGRDGEPWPDPWMEAGTQVISSSLDAGRGRFDGWTTMVARMVLPGFSEVDVDVAVTVAYEDYYSQGIGFYVRQNGGALQQSKPFGQGYAVYVEGGAMQYFGIWRETDGVEVPIVETSIEPPIDIQDQQPYRIRFQCFMEGDQTHLRGRMWPVGEAEPDTWIIDILDDTPELQGTAGSFAVDVYNYAGMGSAYIDDLVIERMAPA